MARNKRRRCRVALIPIEAARINFDIRTNIYIALTTAVDATIRDRLRATNRKVMCVNNLLEDVLYAE